MIVWYLTAYLLMSVTLGLMFRVILSKKDFDRTESSIMGFMLVFLVMFVLPIAVVLIPVILLSAVTMVIIVVVDKFLDSLIGAVEASKNRRPR